MNPEMKIAVILFTLGGFWVFFELSQPLCKLSSVEHKDVMTQIQDKYIQLVVLVGWPMLPSLLPPNTLISDEKINTNY